MEMEGGHSRKTVDAADKVETVGAHRFDSIPY